MLRKEFFLRICKYANANWKAYLSGTEMNEQAEEMLEEYKISKEEVVLHIHTSQNNDDPFLLLDNLLQLAFPLMFSA